MADFDIDARLNLVGINSGPALKQLQAQLRSLKAPNLGAQLNLPTTSVAASSKEINGLTSSMNKLNTATAKVSTTTSKSRSSQEALNKSIKTGTNNVQDFADKAGLALRRFTAFSIAAGGVFGSFRAISGGIRDAIAFERELLRVTQVTRALPRDIRNLRNEIGDLSTTFGTEAKQLVSSAQVLAQAGFSLEEVRSGLEAVAKSSLAPTFRDTQQTTEALIAVSKQFGVEAQNLENALGSINAVAGQFAVESDDIVKAIQRAGGVFAASSQDVASGSTALAQFLALFTSVRQTTRESAETIATGIRTITTRLQRPATIEFFRGLGLSLQDANGQFVGAFDAIQKIGRALEGLSARDPRFSAIVEQIGGFRQVSRVIPLLQQTTVQTQALNTALAGQNSLSEEADIAFDNLAVQIQKTRENFSALFRDIVASNSFQALAQSILGITNNLVSLARTASEVLPILAAVGTAGAVASFTRGGGFQGFAGRVFGGRFQEGGQVPGTGSGDKIPILAEPGEFVLRKSAVQKIGLQNVRALNSAGVQRFQRGGLIGNAAFREGADVFLREGATRGLDAGQLQAEVNNVAQTASSLDDALDSLENTLRQFDETTKRALDGQKQNERFLRDRNLAGGTSSSNRLNIPQNATAEQAFARQSALNRIERNRRINQRTSRGLATADVRAAISDGPTSAQLGFAARQRELQRRRAFQDIDRRAQLNRIQSGDLSFGDPEARDADIRRNRRRREVGAALGRIPGANFRTASRTVTSSLTRETAAAIPRSGILGVQERLSNRINNSGAARFLSSNRVGIGIGGAIAGGIAGRLSQSQDPNQAFVGNVAQNTIGFGTGAAALGFGPLGVAVAAVTGTLVGFDSALKQAAENRRQEANEELRRTGQLDFTSGASLTQEDQLSNFLLASNVSIRENRRARGGFLGFGQTAPDREEFLREQLSLSSSGATAATGQIRSLLQSGQGNQITTELLEAAALGERAGQSESSAVRQQVGGRLLATLLKEQQTRDKLTQAQNKELSSLAKLNVRLARFDSSLASFESGLQRTSSLIGNLSQGGSGALATGQQRNVFSNISQLSAGGLNAAFRNLGARTGTDFFNANNASATGPIRARQSGAVTTLQARRRLLRNQGSVLRNLNSAFSISSGEQGNPGQGALARIAGQLFDNTSPEGRGARQAALRRIQNVDSGQLQTAVQSGNIEPVIEALLGPTQELEDRFKQLAEATNRLQDATVEQLNQRNALAQRSIDQGVANVQTAASTGSLRRSLFGGSLSAGQSRAEDLQAIGERTGGITSVRGIVTERARNRVRRERLQETIAGQPGGATAAQLDRLSILELEDNNLVQALKDLSGNVVGLKGIQEQLARVEQQRVAQQQEADSVLTGSASDLLQRRRQRAAFQLAQGGASQAQLRAQGLSIQDVEGGRQAQARLLQGEDRDRFLGQSRETLFRLRGASQGQIDQARAQGLFAGSNADDPRTAQLQQQFNAAAAEQGAAGQALVDINNEAITRVNTAIQEAFNAGSERLEQAAQALNIPPEIQLKIRSEPIEVNIANEAVLQQLSDSVRQILLEASENAINDVSEGQNRRRRNPRQRNRSNR